MKTIFKNKSIALRLMPLIAVAIAMFLASCGKSDPAPSAQETTKAKLVSGAPWKIQSVTVDDVDKSSMYTGMTLQFTATGGYSSSKGTPVWPASGTWEFTSQDAQTIKREDGVLTAITVTDTSLKLSLTWNTTTLAGGRVESLKGVNVFTFTK